MSILHTDPLAHAELIQYESLKKSRLPITFYGKVTCYRFLHNLNASFNAYQRINEILCILCTTLQQSLNICLHFYLPQS